MEKPEITLLPTSSNNKKGWCDALEPRLKLAEWAVEHTAQDMHDAQISLQEYSRNCPSSLQELRDIAAATVLAIHLINAQNQIDAIRKNIKEYEDIRDKLNHDNP